MIKVSLHFLSTLLNAEYIGSENVDITEVTIDTRKVTAGCLFVALKGERFDGHDFAEDAVAAGAGAPDRYRPRPPVSRWPADTSSGTNGARLER